TPFYAILDANENVIATSADRTTDSKLYLAFLQKGVVATPGPAPSTPAPSKQVADAGDLPHINKLGGGPFDTSALNGKVVVVDFWATWCVPCVQEIPGFNRILREYGPKGVAVVGVSLDDDGAKSVEPFLKKHPMEYTVALGPEPLFKQFQIDELPVTVIFGRDGKLVKRFNGFTKEQEIQAAVQSVL
ncbi:MAG: TlpA family protein disulfide reductase, partial [Acidobacteriia bacterium]|nr:TlpA family protein disulfide reductase [Terriglobia bacterium]